MFLVVCAVGQLKCIAQKAYILCSEYIPQCGYKTEKHGNGILQHL